MSQPHDLPGLYLHVPFCARICPYCDFAVIRDEAAQRERFVEHLVREIAVWGDRWRGESFDTIYFGGGTPSRLDPEQLERILRAIGKHLPTVAEPWITLEANPEDAGPERWAAFRALGVRTLSLGVQSFDRSALKFLGRRHTPEQAHHAALLARDAGFEVLSLDLIFGLPGAAGAVLESSLEAVLALQPQHVSCYQLTFHDDTPFGRALARGRLAELPESDQAAAFDRVHRVLGAGGYEAYEVSNFARRPAFRSRHNQKYWRHVPYLGLGPSAHSFDGRVRFWNERHLATWSGRIERGEPATAGSERLSEEDLALERLMLGLRTVSGVELRALDELLGFDFQARHRQTLERLAAVDLVVLEAGFLRPTRAGLAVADGLVRHFV